MRTEDLFVTRHRHGSYTLQMGMVNDNFSTIILPTQNEYVPFPAVFSGKHNEVILYCTDHARSTPNTIRMTNQLLAGDYVLNGFTRDNVNYLCAPMCCYTYVFSDSFEVVPLYMLVIKQEYYQAAKAKFADIRTHSSALNDFVRDHGYAFEFWINGKVTKEKSFMNRFLKKVVLPRVSNAGIKILSKSGYEIIKSLSPYRLPEFQNIRELKMTKTVLANNVLANLTA